MRRPVHQGIWRRFRHIIDSSTTAALFSPRTAAAADTTFLIVVKLVFVDAKVFRRHKQLSVLAQRNVVTLGVFGARFERPEHLTRLAVQQRHVEVVVIVGHDESVSSVNLDADRIVDQEFVAQRAKQGAVVGEDLEND